MYPHSHRAGSPSTSPSSRAVDRYCSARFRDYGVLAGHLVSAKANMGDSIKVFERGDAGLGEHTERPQVSIDVVQLLAAAATNAVVRISRGALTSGTKWTCPPNGDACQGLCSSSPPTTTAGQFDRPSGRDIHKRRNMFSRIPLHYAVPETTTAQGTCLCDVTSRPFVRPTNSAGAAQHASAFTPRRLSLRVTASKSVER